MSNRDGVTRLYEVPKPNSPERQARQTAKFLDLKFYLARNGDVRAAGVEPEKHFLTFGIREDRDPSAWFSRAYVRNQLKCPHLDGPQLLERYQASDLPDRPRILFVGHEASRTGAPAIILRLAEMFSQSRSVECITILDEGGERLHDFQAASHVYVMSKSRREKGLDDVELFGELEQLFGEDGGLHENPPVIALVNSAESVRIARALERLKIPIISLIHEFASFYEPAVFEAFSAISESVIMPSQIIRQTALDHANLDEAKLTVRGQGLLQDGFGTLNREACRALLRKRLDLPDDAFIVLNVGSLELRKGVDSFVRAACLFCELHPEHEHVYFLWYGGKSALHDPALRFAEQEIAHSGLAHRIRFLPSTALIDPIFQGADLFFLSARADPFPCVVHEALACALPVLAFRNGGGAAELIGDDCGTLVDMGDCAAAATAIHTYLTQPKLLQAHGANAVRKIREDWKFDDYFAFVREEMQKVVGSPVGQLPLRTPTAPLHLVLSAAEPSAIETLKQLGPDDAQTRIILLSRPADIGLQLSSTLDRLVEQGADLHLSRSLKDDVSAVTDIVHRAVQRANPDVLTVIDAVQALDPDLLRLLACRKRLVLIGRDIDQRALYRVGLWFDEIHAADPALRAGMAGLNPLIAEKITPLTAVQ